MNSYFWRIAIVTGREGSRHPGATLLDKLPTCSYQTLERAMFVPDTIQLEQLAWAVFDNVMGPGETPPLCGFETYDKIIRRLASKAYKGVHTHCPAWTSHIVWHRGDNRDSGKSRV